MTDRKRYDPISGRYMPPPRSVIPETDVLISLEIALESSWFFLSVSLLPRTSVVVEVDSEAVGPVEALEYAAEEPLESEEAVLERADGRVEVVGLR